MFLLQHAAQHLRHNREQPRCIHAASHAARELADGVTSGAAAGLLGGNNLSRASMALCMVDAVTAVAGATDAAAQGL